MCVCRDEKGKKAEMKGWKNRVEIYHSAIIRRTYFKVSMFNFYPMSSVSIDSKCRTPQRAPPPTLHYVITNKQRCRSTSLIGFVRLLRSV